MFKAVERNMKLPKTWKIAAVSLIHEKGERKIVKSYRPVSLLNIESKIFEKCIWEELSAHFTKFLSSKQHGFVPQRSVYTNMLLFLKKIHEALDKNVQSEVVVFYTDFAKAFNRVPHYELLLKTGQIGIGGCLIWLSQRTRTICPSGHYQIETFTSDNWGPTGITSRTDLILHIHQRPARCPQIWRTLYVRG